MEHALTCNNLKCRRELSDRALVTTCSHIFCLDCAHRLGVTAQETERRNTCPACNSQLINPDDAVIANLNPSEDYKTSVLSGLSPNVIMECAGRALSFWAYQTTQDIYYQQYLYKTLTEKYSNLSIQLDKTVNDANAEIDGLQNKFSSLATEQDALRRKNEELNQAYREKTRKLLQTQELYDKVKRKAEMGHIQRAASDAVDSTLQTGSHANPGFPGGLPGNKFSENSPWPAFSQSQRFDLSNMNTSMPRSNFNVVSEESQWPRLGGAIRAENSATPMVGSRRQRVGGPPMLGPPNHPGPGGTPAPISGIGRQNLGTNTPSFANNRGSLAGVGLTSGLKVSQPTNPPRLDASMRAR
ncbi:Fc.00g085890.m01.CDS01 [Cosmosporella sp. VM-42]